MGEGGREGRTAWEILIFPSSFRPPKLCSASGFPKGLGETDSERRGRGSERRQERNQLNFLFCLGLKVTQVAAISHPGSSVVTSEPLFTVSEAPLPCFCRWQRWQLSVYSSRLKAYDIRHCHD